MKVKYLFQRNDYWYMRLSGDALSGIRWRRLGPTRLIRPATTTIASHRSMSSSWLWVGTDIEQPLIPTAGPTDWIRYLVSVINIDTGRYADSSWGLQPTLWVSAVHTINMAMAGLLRYCHTTYNGTDTACGICILMTEINLDWMGDNPSILDGTSNMPDSLRWAKIGDYECLVSMRRVATCVQLFHIKLSALIGDERKLIELRCCTK